MQLVLLFKYYNHHRYNNSFLTFLLLYILPFFLLFPKSMNSSNLFLTSPTLISVQVSKNLWWLVGSTDKNLIRKYLYHTCFPPQRNYREVPGWDQEVRSATPLPEDEGTCTKSLKNPALNLMAYFSSLPGTTKERKRKRERRKENVKG